MKTFDDDSKSEQTISSAAVESLDTSSSFVWVHSSSQETKNSFLTLENKIPESCCVHYITSCRLIISS